MERKSYYMVLGVSSSETTGGIRAAFRDLAKKLHPDVAGEQATRSFQEVAEAYGVLSDPQRRREYNRKLTLAEGGEIVPVRSARPGAVVREPVAILGNPAGIRPSFEAMYERFLRNFTGIGIPKSEHLEGLNLEVLLAPEEASRGCIVPLGVPVFSPCPQCGGSGRDWVFPCANCQQQGIIEREALVRIRIPPLVRSGSVFEIPLQGLGIHNFFLRLHVRMQAFPE